MSGRSLETCERAIRWLLETVVAVLLASMALICFVEVVLRYGFGRSFGWYDEFTGYLLVWLTFLGAVLAQHEKRHIAVGNLAERLGPRAVRWASLLAHGFLAAVHLVLLYYGALLATRFPADRAITLPVPMGVLYLVIPLSAALMLAVQLIQVGRLVRSPADLASSDVSRS
jgi:TRAP-type C4-dicarboxylate transport system permease small subunit